MIIIFGPGSVGYRLGNLTRVDSLAVSMQWYFKAVERRELLYIPYLVLFLVSSSL